MLLRPGRAERLKQVNWPLRSLLLLLMAILILLLALLRPVTYDLPITGPLSIHADGIQQSSEVQGAHFRFTAAAVALHLPGVSPAEHLLTLRLHNGFSRSRHLRVRTERAEIAMLSVEPGWQDVTILIPPAAISPWRATVLWLETEAGPGQASRMNGMPLARLTLTQRQWPAISYDLMEQLLLCLAGLGAALLIAGLPFQEVLGATTTAAVGLAAAVAVWRLETATLLPSLLATLGWSIVLALLGRLLARAFPGDRPWPARVAAVAMALFAVHAAGMNAPQFINIDHVARANHVLLIAAGRAGVVQARLANQYEWGIRSVPYSLLSYYLLAPFAWLWQAPRRLAANLKIVVSLIDSTTPLLLYALVRLQGERPRLGWYAALCYAALPLTHLYFHDGSYPTILGMWASVVALLALTHPGMAGTWPVAWFAASTGLLAVATLMYVTQLAFVPTTVVAAGLVAALFGADRVRSSGLRWAVAGLGALALALALYYGQALAPLARDMVARLAAGGRVGTFGRMPLPKALVGSFWEQAWGHVRWIGLLLALVGLAVLTVQRRPLAYIGWGYMLFLAVTSLVDMRFSLWNKHWYFALPGIALLAGAAAASAGRSGRAARLAIAAVLLYLVWESAHAWWMRVFLYLSSLQTL